MEMQATYVSVWDGGIEIKSKCKFNLKTGEVSEIQSVDTNVEVLEDEYILCGGQIYRNYEIID
jgi:hypothetical protein